MDSGSHDSQDNDLRLHYLEAELTALPSCGHFLQEDAPERVGHARGARRIEPAALRFATQRRGRSP